MSLYVLGDPHLSLGSQKPMDIFAGWDGYVSLLEENWKKTVQPEDTILLAGKGHEDYQIIGHEKRHFDEREVVAEALKTLG